MDTSNDQLDFYKHFIRKKIFEQKLLPRAEPWTDKIKYKKVLVVQGETFCPPLLFPHVKVGDVDVSNQGLRYKSWGYRHCLLPRGSGMPNWVGSKQGVVFFTTDVVIATLYQYNPNNVWMSLTPAEMLSQRSGIRFAQGTVVLAGLGMGWLLDKICAKRNVREVIVVEKSQDLMDWYGYRLCEDQYKVSKVIVDDIYNVVDQFDPKTHRFLFDIWAGYGDAGLDEKYLHFLGQPNVQSWGWGLDRYR